MSTRIGEGAFGDEGIEVRVRWKPANGIAATRLKSDTKKERRKVSSINWTKGLRDDMIVMCVDSARRLKLASRDIRLALYSYIHYMSRAPIKLYLTHA